MAPKTISNHLLDVSVLLVFAIVLVVSATSEQDKCLKPYGDSCTDSTPIQTRAEGLGVYYESPCYGVGCGFFRPYCRLCWIDPKAPGRMDRPQCPQCVIDRERRTDTQDLRCKLPPGNSCTSGTPKNTKKEGLGVYYENPCHGAGCGFFQPYCRLCWIDPKAPGRMDRPQCPKCVASF
ncbi:unnamed protein product [Rotaria socialis]|uniref:Uncharacterized protein n=1 Tax=Rotaria socialis TaxID=392032 RepID=A0A821QZW3_9BILA|nr:unnamed protein product [Rotaria socialis]CAF4829766.1 unnamed protein product [Rotaria socialis]